MAKMRGGGGEWRKRERPWLQSRNTTKNGTGKLKYEKEIQGSIFN